MATTYPLPTLSCTIDATGIYAPAYADIFLSLQASYQAVFGSDIYLGADSQDAEQLAIFAKAIDDSNQATILAYNNRSPVTAIGAGLSSLIKLNGLSRQPGSLSTVDILVQGVVGTPIVNGIVQDTQGNSWSLPGLVVIPISGAITVTAIAQDNGAILSAPGSVTKIYNPQYGWYSATNPAISAPGAAVENDPALRQRQSVSTTSAAVTVNGAIYKAVSDVSGVTAVKLYDNDTPFTTDSGIPPYTISVVVAGGSVQDIVNAIGSTKSPGTPTYGNISGQYSDPIGIQDTVNYYAVATTQLKATVTVKAKAGYASSTATRIANAVAQLINSSVIGQTVEIDNVYPAAKLSGTAAQAANTDLTQQQLDALSSTFNLQSIQLGLLSGSVSGVDFPIAFNQQAQINAASVTVVVTT